MMPPVCCLVLHQAFPKLCVMKEPRAQCFRVQACTRVLGVCAADRISSGAIIRLLPNAFVHLKIIYYMSAVYLTRPWGVGVE